MVIFHGRGKPQVNIPSGMQARMAAVVLQSGWRARQARLQLRELKAVVVIQKHARGAAARRAILRQHAAATKLQVCVCLLLIFLNIVDCSGNTKVVLLKLHQLCMPWHN